MTLQVEMNFVHAIDLSLDNDLMVVVGENSNITLIDVKAQKSITTMLFFDAAKKLNALVSPDAYKMTPALKAIYNQ